MQELDRIDDFYEAEFQKLGFEMAYGIRTEATSLFPCKHTIAVAYKTTEWALVDKQVDDFAEVEKMLPAKFVHRRKLNMLCLF